MGQGSQSTRPSVSSSRVVTHRETSPFRMYNEALDALYSPLVRTHCCICLIAATFNVKPRPAAVLVPAEVMAQFLELQTLLHSMLDKAVYLDWNQEKMMTLFGNWPGLDWLKIRLGDAFRMLLAHTERHMKQAMRVKAEMGTFAGKN